MEKEIFKLLQATQWRRWAWSAQFQAAYEQAVMDSVHGFSPTQVAYRIVGTSLPRKGLEVLEGVKYKNLFKISVLLAFANDLDTIQAAQDLLKANLYDAFLKFRHHWYEVYTSCFCKPEWCRWVTKHKLTYARCVELLPFLRESDNPKGISPKILEERMVVALEASNKQNNPHYGTVAEKLWVYDVEEQVIHQLLENTRPRNDWDGYEFSHGRITAKTLLPDDPLGPVSGYMANCCLHPHGYAHNHWVHMTQSPDCGTFVYYSGDKFIGQSYVWIAEALGHKVLVVDNIELIGGLSKHHGDDILNCLRAASIKFRMPIMIGIGYTDLEIPSEVYPITDVLEWVPNLASQDAYHVFFLEEAIAFEEATISKEDTENVPLPYIEGEVGTPMTCLLSRELRSLATLSKDDEDTYYIIFWGDNRVLSVELPKEYSDYYEYIMREFAVNWTLRIDEEDVQKIRSYYETTKQTMDSTLWNLLSGYTSAYTLIDPLQGWANEAGMAHDMQAVFVELGQTLKTCDDVLDIVEELALDQYVEECEFMEGRKKSWRIN